MLVLCRKLNETIVIDGGIEITVVRIDRKQVRLAIKAPDQVMIMRAELVAPAVLAEDVASPQTVVPPGSVRRLGPRRGSARGPALTRTRAAATLRGS